MITRCHSCKWDMKRSKVKLKEGGNGWVVRCGKCRTVHHLFISWKNA